LKSFNFINKVKSLLSKKRYKHTLGVLKVSLILARKYKVNQKKIFYAAILHDIAKDIKISKQKKIIEKLKDKEVKKIRDIWHGFVGEILAKKIFGIKDKNILNAIKYHSTGNLMMGNIEKIIFVADYIEPGRHYSSSVSIRKKIKNNITLDELMFLILEKKLIYLIREKKIIYESSIKLWNNLAKLKSFN